ncbi:DNA-binding protein [Actinoplanes sp. NPDC023801]|uniref:DNA-binding protein n=1 Tax=Actinoplanes sp. NPDC023801 TaxID=3154595 RepID=UPI00340D6CBC
MDMQSLRLMGAHEIRMKLGGIGRQRLLMITRRPDFPSPLAQLTQGKVWLADQIDDWLAAHGSEINTPPRTRAEHRPGPR